MVFVVIDGLDASGKSTQAFYLCDHLVEKRRSVCLRFHPSDDNLFGASAQRFLLSKGKSAHFASALFYMLDVIRSVLLYSWRKNDYLIFVRYLMGTAYLPDFCYRIAYIFFSFLTPKPDYTFFLDVEPNEAYRRIRRARNAIEMFETLEKLRKVREKALSMTYDGHWIVVDGSMPENEVCETILEALDLKHARLTQCL